MLPRLTDRTFDHAIQSSQPILVVFTAPVRCHRCREQKPALEELAAEGVPVYLVDVENPDTATVEATLGRRGVPFPKMYANGQLLVENLGLKTADQLRELVHEGAQLAAQMGTHRPGVSGPEHIESLPDRAGASPAGAQRRAGYRTLHGLLSGFGRE